MAADEPPSARNHLSIFGCYQRVNGCMAVCEWDDHTQCRGAEENGSFSQQYNDRGCMTKSRAGGSFTRSVNRTPRATDREST